MTEIVLFVLIIIFLFPIVVVIAFAQNLTRVANGQKPLPIGEAVMEVFTGFANSIKNKLFGSKDTAEERIKRKNSENKPEEFEDADFKEITNNKE